LDQNSITVNNITKIFNFKNKRGITKIMENKPVHKVVGLENVSFNVSEGEMFGIIGLNGSGKTTLLRTIAGIYNPDTGSVHVKGRLAPILQIGIGFRDELNAKENVILFGMLMGFSKTEMIHKTDSILEYAELEYFADMKLRQFSAGMRARLGFSVALQVDPDILLIDEVLSVGDLVFRKKSFDSFLSFKKKKKTILYTTHNLNMISELSDRVLLLHHGKNVMIGRPNESKIAFLVSSFNFQF